MYMSFPGIAATVFLLGCFSSIAVKNLSVDLELINVHFQHHDEVASTLHTGDSW